MFYLNITRVNSRNYLSRLSCSRQFTNNHNRKILNLKTLENNPQIRFLSTTMATSSNFKVTDNVKHKHVNRLINEKSPYLLQHAHNPVEWYSWSEESIKLAKEQNKLIFLSIGYSTCHWCHVMEKESFENEETAAIMNKHFINIKVDREERPEIDKLYMTFILLINGSGGWPLSIWLTPDLAPVTGGTYFPPKDRWGMPGFTTILQKIASKWESDKESLTTTGISVIEAIQKSVSQKRADGDSEDMIMSIEDKFQQAIRIYKKNWDRNWGGSLGAPKFPEVSKINLLLHSYVQTKDKELLDIVTNTLDKIANGGIHDHIFGGFARYSVDKKWHVPHFEKMLYDQGQLLIAYVNAYKITNSIRYLEVAEKIFKYVCKDLYHPGGGFYSGEDADSLPEHTSVDKIEGAFYAFAYGEVEELFEENKSKFTEYKSLKPFDIYSYHFDIKEDGNVEPASDPHGHLLEKNILFVNGSLTDTAEKFGTTPDIVAAILDIGHGILHEYREKRPRPHLDTKIICAWNGLMLSGICKAASVDAPNRDEYLKVANKQIEFIRANLYDTKERKLLRACYGDNETTSLAPKPIYGFLDDYTFLIKGLIDHYIASLDVSSLFWAKELQDLQDEYFWDDTNGGYFYSQANSPDVIVRMKEDHDGAEPCGNSVAANNLILLGAYYEDLNYKNKAIRLSEYFTNVNPFGYVLPEMMSAFLSDDVGLHMLIVVGPDNEESRKLISVASNYYVPGLISILYKTDKPDDITRQSVKQFKAIKGKPTAYVCHNKRCNLPITCPKALAEEFASIYLCTESDKVPLNSQSPLNKK